MPGTPAPPLSDFEAHPPLPDGINWKEDFDRVEGKFPSRTGHGQLWYAAFTPVRGAPKALVLWLHGLHEHSERFHSVFSQLAARGYVAAGLDHLGHGRSEGTRGDVDRFEDFVVDAEAFLALMREYFGQKLPIFVIGQSMGGLMAAHLAIRAGRQGVPIRGVAVVSGAMDVERDLKLKVMEVFSSLLVKIVPQARLVPAVRPEDMSTDPAAVARYVADPLNTIGNLRIKMARVLLDAMEWVHANAQELRAPLLALHGDQDKCTYMVGVQRFVESSSSSDKEFVSFAGLRHELLFEPEPHRSEVFGRIVGFFDRLSQGSGLSHESGSTSRL